MAICDADEQFVKKLAEYLGSQEDFPMEVTAFTDREALAGFIGSAGPDLLLMGGEEVYTPGEGEPLRVIRIGEDRDMAGAKEVIFRYQSRDKLKADILAACSLPGKNTPEPEPEAVPLGDTFIRGVWSPAGRSGKTLFAVTLGEILAQKGRTLYINLEDIHALPLLGAEEGRIDLSDLFYQYRLDKDKVEGRLAMGLRRFDRLEYIPPVFSPEDLKDIEEEEWTGLISLIAGSGKFKEMVLDFGSHAGCIPRLLKLCGRIYVPTLEDAVSRAKLEHFGKILETSSMRGLEERISFVKVPLLPDEGSYPVKTSQLVRGRIGSYIRHRMKNGQISEEREW